MICKAWIVVFLYFLQSSLQYQTAKEVYKSHGDVHYFDPAIHKVKISKEEAFSFLETLTKRVKRSDERCNTDEPYCETHKGSCMLQNENSREYFCAQKGKYPNCTAGQTCFLSTPCPAHYTLGCSDNPCDGIPCQNLGTCTQTDTGYRCNCFLGFDEQNNCEIDCVPGPADVVFLLDSSESEILIFNKSRNAVSNIVKRLPINETDFRISVITYSSQPTVEFFFNEYMTNESVLAAIDAIKPKSGATFTAKALEKAAEILKDNSTGSRHLKAYQYIIIVSDGLSTDRHMATTKAADIASRGINVYVLGVDRENDHREFVNLGSETSLGTRGVFSTRNDDLLHTLYLETINQDCRDACVKNSTSDIMLVLDMSRISLSISDIQLSLVSIIELVSTLDIKHTNISLGLVSFSNTSTTEVKLGEISDADQFISATQALHMKNEVSDVKSALDKLTLSDAFSTQNGARVDSRKLAVIFSSGNWTERSEVKKRIKEIESTGISFIFVAVGEDAELNTFTDISQDDHNLYWYSSRKINNLFYSLTSKTVFASCKPNFF